MKMEKQIVIGLILCTLVIIAGLLPWVYAEDLTYKQGSIVDIKVPCYINNTYCSDVAVCNITINYPNGTNFVFNEPMTNQIAFHNYTLSDSSINGIYAVSEVCFDQGIYGHSTFALYITPDGAPLSQTTSNSFTFLTILFLVLALGFIVFGIASKNLPILLIGIMFGLTLFLFTLQLLMINPVLKSSLSFYSSIVTFYRIYLWIYYAANLFLIVVFIYNLVKFNKEAKNEKMAQKFGGLVDD
jgi:hypothetical protein